MYNVSLMSSYAKCVVYLTRTKVNVIINVLVSFTVVSQMVIVLNDYPIHSC